MAEVFQTMATLRLSGEELDPDDVSSRLQGSPTFAARKGGPHAYPPSRPPRVAMTGIWRRSSGKADGDQLAQQITAILTSLNSNLRVWRTLTERPTADMFCGVWMDEWNQGLSLSPEALQMLGERGIRLELGIYFNQLSELEGRG